MCSSATLAGFFDLSDASGPPWALLDLLLLFLDVLLLLVLLLVEFTDLIFAVDSIPAIFAITTDPFIVLTSNVFAILGLRTLYFVLEALKQYLVHLEKAVVLLLFFVAFKLGLNATDHFWHHGYSISATASLFVVLGVLALGIITSVLFPGKREA